MSKRGSPALVGAFVIGALALGTAAVVVLGSGLFFRSTQPFIVYFRGSVDGLAAGSAVTFKGIEVGAVRDIYINLSTLPPDPANVRIPVIIELDSEKLSARGARVDLGDEKAFLGIVGSGLRAKLASDSILTGMRHVALDMIPGSPAEVVHDTTVPYLEIPTLPTELEAAQRTAMTLLTRVSALDLERSFASVQRILDGTDRVVNAPELAETLRAVRDAAVHLRETSAELRAAAVELRRLEGDVGPTAVALSRNLEAASRGLSGVVERAGALIDGGHRVLPAGSALAVSAQRALADLSETLRAIRQLAERLERDPGAILRGGTP